MSRARTLLGLVAASAAVLALAACSTGAPAASDDASRANEYGLVKAGTLTVATEGTYRPFSFHDDGSATSSATTSRSPRRSPTSSASRSSSRRPSGTRSSRASTRAGST